MTADEEKREALERNLHRLATKGMDAATTAAIEILEDSKASAQARSAAINAVFRSQGLFGQREDPTQGKEPMEMSAEELDRAVKKIMSDRELLSGAPDDSSAPVEQSQKDDKGGIFD